MSRPEYDRLLEAIRRQDRERLAMKVLCGVNRRVSELRYINVEAVWAGQTV